MIFATSLLLGITVMQLRSAAAVIIVAALIAFVFAVAKIVSAGIVPFSDLGWCVLGYNVGLAGIFLVALFPTRGQRLQK